MGRRLTFADVKVVPPEPTKAVVRGAAKEAVLPKHEPTPEERLGETELTAADEPQINRGDLRKEAQQKLAKPSSDLEKLQLAKSAATPEEAGRIQAQIDALQEEMRPAQAEARAAGLGEIPIAPEGAHRETAEARLQPKIMDLVADIRKSESRLDSYQRQQQAAQRSPRGATSIDPLTGRPAPSTPLAASTGLIEAEKDNLARLTQQLAALRRVETSVGELPAGTPPPEPAIDESRLGESDITRGGESQQPVETSPLATSVLTAQEKYGIPESPVLSRLQPPAPSAEEFLPPDDDYKRITRLEPAPSVIASMSTEQLKAAFPRVVKLWDLATNGARGAPPYRQAEAEQLGQQMDEMWNELRRRGVQ